MGLFTPKRKAAQPMGAFTASGATYRVSSYSDASQLALQRQRWQGEAYKMYDNEGHLWYAANYVGSALGRLRLVAARRPSKDAAFTEPEIIEKGAFADAVANIRSPRGGQRGLLRQVGRNVFIAGEVWLIGAAETLADGSTSQSWDACSISELSTSGNAARFQRKRLPGATPENLPDGALTIRIWKEHPEYSDLADSGTRPALGQLKKIVTLNGAEYAIARSAMAGAGILALPQELVPPAWQNQNNNPDQMEANPLLQALADSMIGPLQDEDHPGAVLPLLLVGPGDVISKMKYEPMDRKFDTQGAAASANNAIEQVAATLELPKEILLGTGEATHWTAWAIREDTFQAHIQPLAELTVDALTLTYLKQAIKQMSPQELDAAMKEAGVTDPNDIMVWYDKSQLVILPDKADKAGPLHDRLVISDAALRRENGYSDEDAPPEEEYKTRVGIKMADAKMALTGEPTEPPAPGAGAGNPGPGRPKGTQTTNNGPRATSPQGPNAAPPKTAGERRVGPGAPSPR